MGFWHHRRPSPWVGPEQNHLSNCTAAQRPLSSVHTLHSCEARA